jgi:Fe-S-cluster containining protein
VTTDEATVLHALVSGGIAIDRDRLELQSRRERKSADWLRFFHPENRCVFLGDDNACRIYEHRPSICRKHLVTTPADACTTTGMRIAPVEILMAEILLSAALSIEGTSSGSLAKLLAELLRQD